MKIGWVLNEKKAKTTGSLSPWSALHISPLNSYQNHLSTKNITALNLDPKGSGVEICFIFVFKF